ncbi:hypothetical protein LCGC14_0397330 [marine sediment metagenome]|uniref:Uncharacterized protein n=1 Tax=marine sediment metagenome TaxID=412755 RepID=A0A0F9SY13_9ZZZZ
MADFPALLDTGGPLTQRPAFQQELRDYLPVDAPVLRHINVFGEVSGQAGASMRSLRSTDGQEAAVTVSSATGRSDIWFGIGGTGAYHFNFDNLGNLLLMALNQLVVGYDQWGGALIVEAFDGTNEGGEIVLKGAAANTDWHADNFSSGFRLHHDGNTYVSVAAGGSTQVSQRTTDSGLPVLILEQLDIDDTFTNFIGTSAADGSRSISSDTTEDSTKFGAVRVEINGTTKWVRIYDNES